MPTIWTIELLSWGIGIVVLLAYTWGIGVKERVMKQCEYCGLDVVELYPVEPCEDSELLHVCEKCLYGFMTHWGHESDPIQEYADSDEYRESLMNK